VNIAERARKIAIDIADRVNRTRVDRETKLIDEATFGAECAQMLDSAPFREFNARIEARLTDELIKLPLRDDGERMRLAIALQTQRQWTEFLLKSAQGGRMAEAELEKLRKGRTLVR
jgi:hypothetical protein